MWPRNKVYKKTMADVWPKEKVVLKVNWLIKDLRLCIIIHINFRATEYYGLIISLPVAVSHVHELTHYSSFGSWEGM